MGEIHKTSDLNNNVSAFNSGDKKTKNDYYK